MNPLDAICDRKRPDAVCVSNLKNAKPVDKGVLIERPDVKIFLPFRFFVYEPKNLFIPNTYNTFLVAPSGDHLVSLIDEISYKSPNAPMLSQIDDIPGELFCNGDNRPANCGTNCHCTHKVDIPMHAIVEVVLVDEVQQPNLSHPFHLHGTPYYVVGLGRSPDKSIKKINLKHALELDRLGMLERDFSRPALKDTIAVPNNGYAVLRFRADNPGYWLFHCHFQFHIVIGMNLIFHIGTAADLPPIPKNFPRCGDYTPPITVYYFNKISGRWVNKQASKNVRYSGIYSHQRPTYFAVATDADHLVSLIDEISYISPPSPLLSQYNEIPGQYFCNGDNRPTDCAENCQCTHKIDIPLNAIVEIVLVDEVQQVNISHPFHLHGTSFYVLGLGRSPDKKIKRMNLDHALELDRRGMLERKFTKPALKDTVAVPNNGYAVLRFRADNPGFWLFHCHFQYHIVIGMNLVLQIGTIKDLPPIPPNFPRCGNHLPPITLW